MPKKHTISIKELQDEAESSPLKKGMLVRALPMNGMWSGLIGREFYVLDDKAEPGWGHRMAVRHQLDIGPTTSGLFATARDKDGKLLFKHVSLPAQAVVVLKQTDFTSLEDQAYHSLEEWKTAWNELLQQDEEQRKYWTSCWEKSGDPEDKKWVDIFSRRKSWDEQFSKESPGFSPDMIERWVKDDYDY